MAYQKRQYVRKVFTLFSNGSIVRFDPNLQVSDPWDFEKVVSLMEVHLDYVKAMNRPDTFILDEHGAEISA